MVIDGELLIFLVDLRDALRERMPKVSDSNILKKPMADFCEFVDSAKVGSSIENFVASFIAAVNVADLVSTESAEEKLNWLKSRGVYGSWEKRSVLTIMSGLSNVIDSWISEIDGQPGDLIIPLHILREWEGVVELAKLKPVGGVQ